MIPTDEPEIQDGSRAWPDAQTLLQGVPDPNRTRFDVSGTWYDTSTDDNDGAFCLVQSGSTLEDLIGDIVAVDFQDKRVFLYCIGATDLPVSFAMFRTAWFWLYGDLAVDEIELSVQATVPA